MGLNILDRDLLLRKIAQSSTRLSRIEGLLKGMPFGNARFADLSIINAKIGSLSVNKLIAGILSAVVDVGDSGDASYVLIDAGNNNIVIAQNIGGSPLPRVLIGKNSIGEMTLRVSLPTYNALTDTNPDHFALYTDEDWILIKEKARGSVAVNVGQTVTVAHGLSNPPFFIIMAKVPWATDPNTYIYIRSYNLYTGFNAWANSTYIYLKNSSSSNSTFKYYIFYDYITT